MFKFLLDGRPSECFQKVAGLSDLLDFWIYIEYY